MLKNFRFIFWILLTLFAIVVFIIIYTQSCNAETYSQEFGMCVSRCKASAINLDECIKDEKKYWDTNHSDVNFKYACMDLIRNEKLSCYSDCVKSEEQRNKEESVTYYEHEVQEFPLQFNQP